MLVIMEAEPSKGEGSCFSCGGSQFSEHNGWIECQNCDFAILKADWERVNEEKINEIKSKLSSLLDDFVNGRPYPCSEELSKLAEDVVKNHREMTPEEVKEWAKRLASDVCELGD